MSAFYFTLKSLKIHIKISTKLAQFFIGRFHYVSAKRGIAIDNLVNFSLGF